MSDILLARLIETVGMLPILHAPEGDITVAAVGTMQDVLVEEALHWRDIKKVYVLSASTHRDPKVTLVEKLPAASIHALLISPEQEPGPWWPALAKDGVISASTSDKRRWQALMDSFRTQLGKATPWRNYLPAPLYGVIGRNGPAKAGRTRQPRKKSLHLSPQYLPVLFTFARDELPMAFTRPKVRIANQPEGVSHELARHSTPAQHGLFVPLAGR